MLMLTTLGLGRLEQTLSCDTVTASDVAEFLEQAQAADVHRLARDGMPEALAYLHRREAPALTEAPAPGPSPASITPIPTVLPLDTSIPGLRRLDTSIVCSVGTSYRLA
ncbi:hypothetical protein [Mycobacterium kansasii]|uniref:hypothetical protein n=1 Tax=Mycobacterium kansasii TaxID=1768 RepID=UPI0034A0B38B